MPINNDYVNLETPKETELALAGELSTESQKVTTDQLLGVETIERGIIRRANGQFNGLLQLAGLDMKLMSYGEKERTVRRLAALFNTQTAPFSFYASVRPRSLQSYIQELNERRTHEAKNGQLRRQYWLEQDFLSELEETHNLTERHYYLALGTNPESLPTTQPATYRQRLKQNWQKTWGDGVRSSSSSAKGVPVSVAADLNFRLEALAERFNALGLAARPLGQTEVVQLLTGYFNANAGQVEDANALVHMSNLEMWEYPNYLKLGEREFAGSLWLTDLPGTVRFGALFEILSLSDITLQLAVHVRPVAPKQAERKLKSRQQVLFAVKANDKSEAGNLGRDHKLQEMRELRRLLARGEVKLFQMGVRLTVRAASQTQLESDLRRVKQRLTELGYGVAAATCNERRAFLSSVPTGADYLGREKFISDRTLHPNLTGEQLVCFLPNCIVEAEQQGGIILGVSKADGGLVSYNRWEQVNPHTVVVATSGGGKTVSMEIEALREMLQNPRLEVWYVDPQGVVGKLARLVGGTTLDMGETGNVVINPMDRFVLNGLPETLGQRLKFLYPLLELMLRSSLSATDRSAIARALKRLYRHFEEGEDMLTVLEQSFLNQALYAPLRPYLYDTANGEVGILTKLATIYAELTAKYQIPSTGLVRGLSQAGCRPHTYLDQTTNRWYYRGEGETHEPNQLADELAQAAQTALNSKHQIADHKIFYPAQVIYPDREWYLSLMHEFEQKIEEAGLFDQLDDLACHAAINDSFVALKRGMPVLRDWLPFLAAEGATHLVANLEQFVDDTVYGKLFNGFTNVRLDKRFIAFNVQALDEDFLRPIRIFQLINFTWGMTQAIRLPRLFIVDEFGLLLQNFEDVARYVRNLFMRGRAFYLGMTAIVQNITSLLDYQAARQCVENAERVILMKQQEDAIERLQAHYKLTAGQVDALLSAKPGEALQKMNGHWVHVRYVIAPEHLAAFDTRPVKEA